MDEWDVDFDAVRCLLDLGQRGFEGFVALVDIGEWCLDGRWTVWCFVDVDQRRFDVEWLAVLDVDVDERRLDVYLRLALRIFQINLHEVFDQTFEILQQTAES